MLNNYIPLLKAPCDFGQGYVIDSNTIDANQLTSNLKIELNVIPNSSGSAAVEMLTVSGVSTRVICAVRGPYATKRGGFNDTCQLECSFRCVDFEKYSTSDDIIASTSLTADSDVHGAYGTNGNCGNDNEENLNMISILEGSLLPMICVEKYPKSVISISWLVVQVRMVLIVHICLMSDCYNSSHLFLIGFMCRGRAPMDFVIQVVNSRLPSWPVPSPLPKLEYRCLI